MLDYCKLSETPAFQNLVADLTPALGDRANHEALRDYMEYNGTLRTPEQILAKLSNDYFSAVTTTYTAKELETQADAEIVMTDVEKFRGLGISKPKKQISSQQIINLKKVISLKNNDLVRERVDRVYVLETKQVGEKLNDNFTWEIKVYRGKLDLETKANNIRYTTLERNMVPTPIQQGTMDLFASDNLTATKTEANYSQEIIRKMADAMGQQIGVDYSFITPQEAIEITKNSDNPWRDQKSFFFNGKIYFIAGSLTPDDILHEYVHPIMRSIAKQNRSLFNSLYDKVGSTQEGRAVVEEVMELYPNLDIAGDDFKEEVLVRSLAKIQDLNSKGLEKTAEFQKFVDNLLYAIKQFLRGIFGQKIRVADLNTSTTLKELSDMLAEGSKFELDAEIITDTELVAYKNDYIKSMKGFVAENANAKEIEDLTNNLFNSMQKHLVNARTRNDLGELVDILQNKYKQGELEKMRSNLKSYQTLIQSDSKKLEDEIELTRERVEAIINSLGNIDNMATQFYEALQELSKDFNDRDNIQRVLYIQNTLKYWGEVANATAQGLANNGVRDIKLLDGINANIKRAESIIEDFYQKSSRDVIWDILKPTAENIDKKWKERIEDLEKRKAPQTEIDQAKASYQKERVTPEQINKALDGSLKDLNFAQMYLEGASYSPDPLVGGVALAVKNTVTAIEVGAQKKFNEAATQLRPLLDKVGQNRFKSWELGEKVGQKEKVGHVNQETGEFEEVEIWRFANEFTGAEVKKSEYQWKIKQASTKYAESGTEEDRKALADIQAEYADHDRRFFNGPYTEEFYKAYDIIKKDEVGNEARMRMNDLYDKLNSLSSSLYAANSDDVLDITDQIEVVRRQIKQLSSLYDLAGELKSGPELEMAKRLQAFNEAIKDKYESFEIPGLVQSAYQAYEQKLLDEGKKPGDGRFEEQMSKWLEKNFRTAIKDSFWTKMDTLSKAIQDILSTIPQQDALNLEIDEAYKVIKEMVKGNRDESGQPLGSELSPERQQKVKEAQEQINKARENLNRMSGLTKQEQNELNAIIAKLHMPGNDYTKEDAARLGELMKKQNSLRLDSIQRAELNSLFNEMDELRTKEPTDSYVDTINNFLAAMDSESVYEILNNKLEIDKENAFLVGNFEIAENLFQLSPEFQEWFERNHILKETVDMETNEIKEVYERTYAWNVIKPRDEKYYEKTSVQNTAGETVVIGGLPSMKYFKRLVKDEFLTPEIVGVTKDNRGGWLPKNAEQGKRDGNWDDRYINKEYQRLKVSDPDLFQLMEKMKEIHLKNQEGLGKKEKLWLDFPRYRKDTAERLYSENPVMRIVQRVKDFFSDVKDKWETGFNWDDNSQLVKMDLFDDERSGIPMGGIARLDINEASTNILYTMMKYTLAGERNRELTKISPLLRMIQATVNNPKNFPVDTQMMKNRTLFFPNRKKEKYLRAKAINNYIEKTLEGKVNTGWGSDSTIAQNFSRAVFSRASSAFLAFNIPSALKNSLGQKFQSLVESVGGKYFSSKDLFAAEGWATNTAFKISGELYKQEAKSLDVQLVEIFDPERDRFSYKFGESFTRTLGKDYTFNALERMTDFRKWIQLQASLQTFGAMMRHQVIKTTDGQNISYMDAWEVRDGKIQTKSNVPAEWGVSYDKDGNQIIGDKFKQKRNEIQRVIDNLNGAMGREESSEANRYLAFRYISFFRRFLTSMITNRFAKNRHDFTLSDTKQGWYITFLQLLAKSFKAKGQNLAYMTSEEKAASLRIFTEIGVVTLLKYLVVPILFGFDGDDPDRFKKLRAKSGALPWLGVEDDPTRPFNVGGFISNHALLQILQINNENEQFLPFPGYGIDSYKEMTNLQSMAMGPTLHVFFNIIQDAANLATGDEAAYYQRSTSPYKFAQEGDPKIIAHMARAFGITGSTIDPANSIKNFESIQNR